MPDILGKLLKISASQLGALYSDIKLAVYIFPELILRYRRDRRQLVVVASERHLHRCEALAVLVLIFVDLVWCFFWCFALVLVRVDDVASCKFIHRTEVCSSWPRYYGSCPWQCDVLLIAQSSICVKGSVPFGVSSSNSDFSVRRSRHPERSQSPPVHSFLFVASEACSGTKQFAAPG